MLGKLLKHEFKAVNRLMIPLHLGLVVITIIGRFYVQFVVNREHVNYSNTSLRMWEGLMDVMLVSAYVIALIAIFIITWLYMDILRFRKNLFTDEGYLMHTLPASAAEHIFAKLTVSTVWQIIDGLLICLSVFAMLANKTVFQFFGYYWDDMWISFSQIFGVSAGIGVPIFLITGLLDTIAGTLIIYMCIAIGHSFNTHKIISSIGIYMGYKFVANLLSSIVVALTSIGTLGNMNAGSLFFGVGSYYSSFNSPAYFWANIGFSIVLSLALGAGAFVLTNHFMTKRLNLE